MKVKFSHIISLCLAIMTTIPVSGQLKVLPADPAIKTGILPNGIHYYIATDDKSGNRADFLLVQRNCPSATKDTTAILDGSLLKGSERFPSNSIQNFMLRNSINYNAEGYLSRKSDSNIYTFRKIRNQEHVQDSVLLAIFDLIERTPSINPADQAIIISGKVNADRLIDKAKYMSLMVPRDTNVCETKEYQWRQCDTAKFQYTSEAVGEDLVYVSISYNAPRLPKDGINTILPLVSGQMTRELGEIIKYRLQCSLEHNNIPCAGIFTELKESISSPSDEMFSMKVYTSETHAEAALRQLVSVLAEIDEGIISLPEYTAAHNIILHDWYRNIKASQTMNSKAQRCVNSFLYGSSLASEMDMLSYIGKKMVDPEQRLKLFTNYAHKLIDKDQNVTVETSSALDIKEIYYSAWAKHSQTISVDSLRWDLDFIAQPGDKVKVLSKKTEPLSKGRIWTFPNGIKVAYLQKPTEGRLYYKMVLNGGLSIDNDMKRGEGAFYGDIFFTGKFNGVEGKQFERLLNANGMTMLPEAGVSRFSLTGSASSDNLDLFAGALLTAIDKRESDANTYNYYMQCQKMRMSSLAESRLTRMAAIDSLLFPSNRYALYKNQQVLKPGLEEKANTFYKDHFRKINDGIIVIIGDREEKDVLNTLTHYLGRMRTNPSIAYKSKRLNNPLSGTSTYTVSGDYPSFDIVMSAPLIFSSANHAIFNIALMALQDEISASLEGTGMYADIRGVFIISPQERSGVMISTELADCGSLIENIPETIYSVVDKIRHSLVKLSEQEISEDKLKIYKNDLNEFVNLEMSSPQYWLDVVSLRYCNGKDISTQYGKRIESVTASQIKSLISELNKGGKIEYISEAE